MTTFHGKNQVRAVDYFVLKSKKKKKKKILAPGGIEPTTFALLARRSNQLSYGAS
jgi:hypothetical protein